MSDWLPNVRSVRSSGWIRWPFCKIWCFLELKCVCLQVPLYTCFVCHRLLHIRNHRGKKRPFLVHFVLFISWGMTRPHMTVLRITRQNTIGWQREQIESLHFTLFVYLNYLLNVPILKEIIQSIIKWLHSLVLKQEVAAFHLYLTKIALYIFVLFEI